MEEREKSPGKNSPSAITLTYSILVGCKGKMPRRWSPGNLLFPLQCMHDSSFVCSFESNLYTIPNAKSSRV
jgi:hypothetical protein